MIHQDPNINHHTTHLAVFDSLPRHPPLQSLTLSLFALRFTTFIHYLAKIDLFSQKIIFTKFIDFDWTFIKLTKQIEKC